MLAAAAVASVGAICAIEELGPDWVQLRLLAAASLGIPLFIALTLLAEERGWRGGRRAGLLALGALLLAGVYAAWPTWSEDMQGLRYVQLSIAMHLLVAILPMAGSERHAAFWQYNRRLLLRFLVSAIASATLFAGLALALLAIKVLFSVDVSGTGLARLWVVLAFVFNTWFFLGGLPLDLARLEEAQDYPPALKVFAQYILVPLVSIYLVILTLYLAKVLVTRDWPSGWIGWLVSGVAAAGILALLLVHPLAEREDERWIAVFARDFWIAMLPANVMLWLAIYQRVRQYGITEPRYFLLVLSVWLAGVALYFTVTRSRRIRVIPASLCVLAFITFVGPWGAYGVAERSQVARLRVILERHRAGQALPVSDSREVSAVVRYLVETHDARPLAPLLPDSVRARLTDGRRGDDRVRDIVTALGAEYVDRGERAPQTQWSVSAGNLGAVPVSGYTLLLWIRSDTALADTGFAAVLAPDHRSVEVHDGKRLVIAVPLDSLITAVRPRAAGRRRPSLVLPQSRLMATASSGQARAAVVVSSIRGRDGGRGRAITSVSGEVLVSLPR